MVALAGHPFPSAMPLLFAAMGDDSWRVRKEAVTVVAEAKPLPEEAIESLIGFLRSSENAGLRNSAVESLERIGAAAVERLCAHLNDSDQDLRKFVIDILGNIGCSSCVPLLVKALDDIDTNVRVAAAENLGKLKDHRALPHLLAVLEGGDVWLKFAALDALALIGTPVPLSSLTPLLRESLLKRATYDCLAVLGNGECIPLLLEGIQEKAKNAREAAAVALMRIRGRLCAREQESLVDQPLKELNGSTAAKKLIDSLHSEDPMMVEALTQLIGIMGDERAALPLLRVSRSERLRSGCLGAFRRIGPAVMPALLEHYPVAFGSERAVVAQLVGEMGDANHAGLLFAGLADESPELRRCSALALGRLAPPGAAPRLAAALEDDDPQVRQAALEALRKLAASDPCALDAIGAKLCQASAARKRRSAAVILGILGDGDRLVKLAKDVDPSVRRTAVASLARVAVSQGVSQLAMALSDEEPEVRIAAAQALSEVGGAEVQGPLLLALTDADPWVQTAALKGLAALADPAALPAVAALAAKAQGQVLVAALRTVAAVGGKTALAPVQTALSHSDEEVVEAAIGILAGFGDDWIAGHCDQLLGHPHWMVRRCFVRAVAQLQGPGSLAILDRALAGESDPLVKGELAELVARLR